MDLETKAYIDKKLTKVIIPGAFNATQAAKYLGVGRTTFYNWRSQGLVRPKFINGVQRYLRKDLDRLLEGA